MKRLSSAFPRDAFRRLYTCSTARDGILQCISENDQVCVLCVTATEVVREAQRRQKTSKAATAVLGRSILAALLMQVVEASAETVQITMHGNGMLGQITAIGSGHGVVKGFVENPTIELPLKSGKVNAEIAVGKVGKFTVILKNKDWKKWKVRTVPIFKGEVAEGIGRYLIKARHLHTVSAFGVSFDKNDDVTCARGYIFQALKDVPKSTLSQMETNIKKLPSMSENSDYDAHKIGECLLEGIGIGDFIDMPTPRFGPCGAELRGTLRTMIGEDMPFYEIKQTLRRKGYVEACCDSCMETFQYSEDELRDHIGQAISDSEEEYTIRSLHPAV